MAKQAEMYLNYFFKKHKCHVKHLDGIIFCVKTHVTGANPFV